MGVPTKQNQIVTKWLDRPVSERGSAHTETFAYDDTWYNGLRLATDRHIHYQKVMALIRELEK